MSTQPSPGGHSPDDQLPGGHPPEDQVEMYCLNRLDDSAVARIEEHLLTCEPCQHRVSDMDVFLKAAKQAARELCAEEKWNPAPARTVSWLSWLNPAFWRSPWIPAATFAALLAVAVPATYQIVSISTPQTVELAALRGEEVRSVDAGKALRLRVDITGLDAADCCLIEVVDSSGRPVQETAAQPKGNTVSVELAKGVASGQHWVRVYSPSRKLLREMGFEAR